jgi:hypothetical protein
MLNEFLLVIGVVIIGGLGVVTVALYFIFKKNLTMRLWLGLTPGICAVIADCYIWARLGGVDNLLLTFTLVPIAIAILIINFLIVGKILMRRINDSTGVLGEAATQVSMASSLISKSSQSLADGSSEQAASIEETSASLEEISAMTKRICWR